MMKDRLTLCICFAVLFALLIFPATCLSAPVLPPLNSEKQTEQLTGKFIWRDLATTEMGELKKFYGEVFGWAFDTISDSTDEYTLVLNGDHSVAGMFTYVPQDGGKQGASWFGIMSVDDPDKAASRVEQLGGVVRIQPKDLPHRGAYALFLDPEGAFFGVLKSSSGDPPDRLFSEVAIGDFIWMDLFADQPDKEAEFYQQLAGYKIITSEVKAGVERLILESQDQPRAGIVPLPEDANRAGWLPYVRVADVSETLEKVIAAGGFVMVEPSEELMEGNLAIFADPQGGVLGVVKWVEYQTGNEGGSQ
ncbi:MAG: VOC family protein [Desulfobacterales bacterium]